MSMAPSSPTAIPPVTSRVTVPTVLPAVPPGIESMTEPDGSPMRYQATGPSAMTAAL